MFASLLLAVTIVAHEPGYTTSLSRHLGRWLAEEQVAASVVTPAEMSAALRHEKIAFLVGFNEPTAAELATLADFRARGGKLVVFHSASPALGRMMGVKPLGYTTAATPGRWSAMKFDVAALAGCPQTLRQTSTVLQRIEPVRGRGKVLAVWLDRAGRATGDAAWVATDAGWWMSHVLLADGDEHEKARLVAAMCGAVDPKLWNAVQSIARSRKRHADTMKIATALKPAPGEIHAVWDHSGCGLYPGDWPRTMRLLKEMGVTDLFVNFAGAGFAHYPSAVLPRSKTFEQEGDQIAACLRAAAGAGVRVHAWILCFNATRSTPARLDDFARRGWRLKGRDGRLSEYLDPSCPDVRNLILAAIDELQRLYPALAGIHLDFVRWYEGADRPPNLAAVISDFVTAVRARVKRPRWLTAAVLGKYPQCIASVGQDWESWLNTRSVDYVVPMDYTEANDKFESFLKQHASSPARASRIIVGIGVTANESRLDATAVMTQILLTRKYKLAGNALFDLDAQLEKWILPYLRMGLWR